MTEVSAKPTKPTKPVAAIFCGDRDWDDPRAVFDTVNRYFPHILPSSVTGLRYVLIEGHARGADRHAHEAATSLGIELACFPADWDKHKRAAGPIRNKQMLDYLLTFSHTHRLLVVAFHDSLLESKGTLNMVKQARRKKVKCINIRHKDRHTPHSLNRPSGD